MSFLICTMMLAILGFSLSFYIYLITGRQTTEHKAMLIIDGLFIASFTAALMSLIYNGVPTQIDRVNFWVTISLCSYIGLVAIHHRSEFVDKKADEEAEKVKEKIYEQRGLLK